jgi:hypothetical protein
LHMAACSAGGGTFLSSIMPPSAALSLSYYNGESALFTLVMISLITSFYAGKWWSKPFRDVLKNVQMDNLMEGDVL